MNLPQNLFDGNINIQVILCQPNKTRIGEILPYDLNGTFKFNTYSEISFSIDRYYNDLLDGMTKVNPYYDLIDSLRVIEIRGVGHFVIQDIDEEVTDNESKSVTCFSLEYSTGQKYLENFYVNTGEEGSIETMYHTQQYGAGYSIDDDYTLADENPESFDAYERYYIKDYSNDKGISYDYVETQILNKEDYEKKYSEFDLYIKKYPNVRFYWPTPQKTELSLLHNIFKLIPEWKIGYVDKELWYQERTFSEDRTAVYDFLYNTAAETFGFVMVWDSIRGEVDFYKTTEDGITANEEIETQWNTDVFISRENLASSIDISYSTDDIKTKLKITGADSLDVRDVNLGQSYITNLSFYNTPLWMGADLSDKYTQYTKLLDEKTVEYKKLISEWSAAYHEYSDLMNYVPVEPRVLLIGDTFDKLYCTYGIVKATDYVENKTYYDNTGKVINESIIKNSLNQDGKTFKEDVKFYINKSSELLPELKKKLGLYRVGIDDNGNISAIDKTDDVLLTLSNKQSDSVTIRVKCKTKSAKYENYEYEVVRTLTTASTGFIKTLTFPLEDWVNGVLTAEKLVLNDEFKIKSIGTLGAYLCLAKDETKKENIEDYGIRLLEEKQDTYTQVFITQTEGYMSQEGSQCVASDDPPEGEIAIGDKWLDTNSDNATIYVYVGKDGQYYEGKWDEYPTDNSVDFENYTRFLDNYEKLQVVQEVLKEKQFKADLLLNGIKNNEFYMSSGNVSVDNLIRVAQMFLIVSNNQYVISVAQPRSDYEIEGTIWFQIDINSEHVATYKYTNKVWQIYNPNINMTLTSYYINDQKSFGYITFTPNSNPDVEYAIYVTNGTPYVSYARSQGLCLAKMDLIKQETDMNTYFETEELVRLSPFIREDEYNDDNFLLTSYESEEEQMHIKQSLLDKGIEELNKICQPKLSFDMTMANILSIPEFAPLKKQFKLGNFVRVGIRDGYVKRARLLEVQINFEEDSDFSCTFGDLISTKSEIDKHTDLLSQAVTVSKSVASNKSHWQKGADKATELDNAINDGLKNAALSIGAADGQAITWDKYGIRGRKLIDGTTDQYHDEQFALINNKLAFTTDNWKTSKAVVGEFEVEINNTKQKMYGLLADALVGGYIQGTEIVGGSLEIGDGKTNLFSVDKDGNVTIKQGGKNMYDAISTIDTAYKYSISLTYTNGSVFSDPGDTSTITAEIYRRGVPVTQHFKDANIQVKWTRNSSETDTNWKPSIISNDSYQITINTNDVPTTAQISCYIDIDDKQMAEIEKNFND